MWNDILKGRTLWILIAAMGFYWGLAIFIPAPLMFLYVGYVTLPLALGVIAAYSYLTVNALRMKKIDRVGQLSLGITVGFVSLTIGVTARVVGAITPVAPATAAYIVGFCFWLYIIAAMLHLTAPGTTRRSLVTIVIIGAAILLVAALVISRVFFFKG